MKTILLFGAGKSATVLIDYLVENAPAENWKITVADANLELAQSKIGNTRAAKAVSFDIYDKDERVKHIRLADIVISMLPPSLHIEVAKDCIQYQKNLLTASYVDEEIRKLKPEIENNKLLFLYEMGLDPGIDHMSAMRIIHEILDQGGRITSFKSHCGGLVAPESDDNPWHYKISWNPRNIILAGKSGAHFREDGEEKKISYEELFKAERLVEIPGIGFLSWYPNRDSLSYAPLYGLQDTKTFIRTTLRHPDFMNGWKNLIFLKLTDEEAQYDTNHKTLKEIFKEHLDKHTGNEWLNHKLPQDDLTRKQLLFLGLHDEDTVVNKGFCSPADILQFAVEKKLALLPNDKDMIVMLHEIGYEVAGREFGVRSALIVKGENNLRTAMAKTVGLPLGIVAKHILCGNIKLTGLHIPTIKEIYEPVLRELERFDIKFIESVTPA